MNVDAAFKVAHIAYWEGNILSETSPDRLNQAIEAYLAATRSADYIAGYNKGREDAAKITDKYRDDFVNSHSKMIRALLHLSADGGQKND